MLIASSYGCVGFVSSRVFCDCIMTIGNSSGASRGFVENDNLLVLWRLYRSIAVQ